VIFNEKKMSTKGMRLWSLTVSEKLKIKNKVCENIFHLDIKKCGISNSHNGSEDDLIWYSDDRVSSAGDDNDDKSSRE
jgi:hypothetical protein